MGQVKDALGKRDEKIGELKSDLSGYQNGISDVTEIKSPNVLDMKKVINNHSIQKSGLITNLFTHALSDYIAVPPKYAIQGTTEKSDGTRGTQNTPVTEQIFASICVYDYRKNVIEASGSNSQVSWYPNTSESMQYVRFSYAPSKNTKLMVEVIPYKMNQEGTKPSDYWTGLTLKGLTVYEDYYVNKKYEIKESVLPKASKLKGLKWYALGDSYTQQGYYTSAIVTATGMQLTNYGVGGTRLADTDGGHSDAMCYRYATMSDEEPDIITVMGGTNDCYYSTLGTPGKSKDVTTIAGAVYTIIRGIQEKYPNALLVFACMPMRWDTRFEEYAQIVLDTCAYYHIPCVDVFHNCGFNEWNKSVYNLNNDNIHVNAKGGERIASLFISKIEECYYKAS